MPFSPLSGILSQLRITTEQKRDFANGMIEEVNRNAQGSDLDMLPSHIFGLPTGKEKGTFITLDMGGSNFRVKKVVLNGDGTASQEDGKSYEFDQDLKRVHGLELFGFIASKVKEFVDKHNIDRRVPIAFTFSFPYYSDNANHAVLTQWQKGFTNAEVEKRDVVKLLSQALDKKGVKNECILVINDSVGTLLSNIYKSPNTKIGVILGTGTNAAFIKDDTFINTEWAAFLRKSDHMEFTKYDILLDEQSSNAGLNRFEKMIGGMYLGELARLILSDFIEGMDAFGPYEFKTMFLSQIAKDKRNIVDIFAQRHLELDELQIEVVNYVCIAVGRRSAELVASAIVGLIDVSDSLKDEEQITVGIDGSLYTKYPGYKQMMEETIRELLCDFADLIILEEAKDGSSVGAAVGAAILSKSIAYAK